MEMKTKVLELYSGIGGMQFAMLEAGIQHELVAAADINTTANTIYQHNFPNTKLITKCIEAISLKEWNKLAADMILMSPPCQPFCRVGKQRDTTDERSKSFLHLLSVLPKLDKIPSYILVENVKGFDTSESRDMLLSTLADLQYHVQEFLLSPLQFGIPNSRLRYYMIAKHSSLRFNFATKPEFRTDVPECMMRYLVHRRDHVVPEAESAAKLSEHQTMSSSCNCVTCHKTKTPNTEHNTMSPHTEHKTMSPHTEHSTMSPNTDNLQNVCGDSISKSEAMNVTQERAANEQTVSCHSGTNVTCEQDPNLKSCDDLVSKQCLKSDSATSGDKPLDNSCIATTNQSETPIHSVETMSQSEGSIDTRDETDIQSEVPLSETYKHTCGEVGTYLEKQHEDYFEQYLIPEKFFKRFWVMDLVGDESKNSCCFTKRYAHHMEGAGSVIEMNTHGTTDLSYFKEKRVYDVTVHEAVRARKLRFFTPREIANLMCFPQSFSFPGDMSNIRMYRVLGNSLNVHVVSIMLRLLTHGDGLKL